MYCTHISNDQSPVLPGARTPDAVTPCGIPRNQSFTSPFANSVEVASSPTISAVWPCVTAVPNVPSKVVDVADVAAADIGGSTCWHRGRPMSSSVRPMPRCGSRVRCGCCHLQLEIRPVTLERHGDLVFGRTVGRQRGIAATGQQGLAESPKSDATPNAHAVLSAVKWSSVTIPT